MNEEDSDEEGDAVQGKVTLQGLAALLMTN